MVEENGLAQEATAPTRVLNKWGAGQPGCIKRINISQTPVSSLETTIMQIGKFFKYCGWETWGQGPVCERRF